MCTAGTVSVVLATEVTSPSVPRTGPRSGGVRPPNYLEPTQLVHSLVSMILQNPEPSTTAAGGSRACALFKAKPLSKRFPAVLLAWKLGVWVLARQPSPTWFPLP